MAPRPHHTSRAVEDQAESDDAVEDVRRRVELPGRRVLTIRLMHQGDAVGLRALYDSLGEEDVYCRFFSGRPPPADFIDRMARVEERGGFGLVAVVDTADGRSRLVGEASCEPLPDGNGELGITVEPDARGWLGPFLLDTLAEEAAARGVPGIEADVLVLNRRMLTLLRHRGFAVMGHSGQPAIVRVLFGTTTGRLPGWPGAHDRPRLLLEVPGGRWHAHEAAQASGYQVLACPGPSAQQSGCPALRGEPCPLVTGADLVVDVVPGDSGASLVDAHRRLHPSVPVCVQLPTRRDDGTREPDRPTESEHAAVIGVLQRLAAATPATASEAGDPP